MRTTTSRDVSGGLCKQYYSVLFHSKCDAFCLNYIRIRWSLFRIPLVFRYFTHQIRLVGPC